MNISCAALVKGAPNKVNAIALVDYLLSPAAQEHFTNNTFEFPMIAGVSPSPLVVNNLGLDFKQDLKTKVSTYGKNKGCCIRSNDCCRMEITLYYYDEGENKQSW
ncbi:MAG: hypothetical protein CM1200mP5_2950 [Candidatus Pelagibacterales bacterium]|nr:MAG: hypothetical protein CM1200mP5_2950 [Pelagibacterales bacterium]